MLMTSIKVRKCWCQHCNRDLYCSPPAACAEIVTNTEAAKTGLDGMHEAALPSQRPYGGSDLAISLYLELRSSLL